jgi:hypothetical protein
MIGKALNATGNCRYTEFGVGFLRNSDTETDVVSDVEQDVTATG